MSEPICDPKWFGKRRREAAVGMPAADEIKVFLLAVGSVTAHLEAQASALLSPEERVTSSRFLQAKDRYTYVFAHALTQRALRDATSRPSCRLVADTHGKPHLSPASKPRLWFNLTHTDGLVACALARKPVGIDAEQVTRSIDWLGIAERFFAREEVEWIRSVPSNEVARAFLKIWTMKEAVVKAAGRGLAMPLDSFAIDPRMARPVLRTDLAELSGRCWLRQEAIGTHEVAVALISERPEAVTIEFSWWSPDDLVILPEDIAA